jgi:enediyne polyketide synthase
MKGQPPLLLLHAREQSRDGDTFEYDLELLGADGTALERWEGLRLRKVETLARRSPWPEALLGPYIERRLEELMPQARISVVLERNGQAERPARSDVAIRQALGTAAVVRRRPDGKPEVPGERAVSVAHAEDFTLAVAGLAPVGCDMEVVVPRSTEAWSDLLGPERLQLAHRISQEASEDTDRAATRVWLASECLKKAGAVINAPLTMNSMQKDGWVLLTAGAIVIATYVAQVREMGNRLAVGFSTLAI